MAAASVHHRGHLRRWGLQTGHVLSGRLGVGFCSTNWSIAAGRKGSLATEMLQTEVKPKETKDIHLVAALAKGWEKHSLKISVTECFFLRKELPVITSGLAHSVWLENGR